LLTTLPVFTRGPKQPVIENGAGPWAVTLAIGAECCDSSGDKFDLYYPTSLGQNGFQHPILTWGNGSNSLSANYTFSMKHMAPGGFVIIAAQDKNSGVGQTILDGANFLTAASNPVSIFFHKLNVSPGGLVRTFAGSHRGDQRADQIRRDDQNRLAYRAARPTILR